MKKTVTKTIPSFKWVVEDLCTECEAKTQDAVVPPGVTIPPPPKVDAKSTSYRRGDYILHPLNTMTCR
jgi:hypothetical protein